MCDAVELLSSHAKTKYSVPRRHYKLFAGQFPLINDKYISVGRYIMAVCVCTIM